MSDALETILARQTAEVRAITEGLRALVRAAAPDAHETAHIGWGSILYGPRGTMKGAFAAILPQRAYVNLQLLDGVNLPDPEGLLEGSGKRMRHVKVRALSELERPSLRALLAAAVAGAQRPA